jgi:L-lactate dehydrogenase complex protein LldF
MKITTLDFKDNAKGALVNPGLQKSMAGVKRYYVPARATAMDKLPEFDALRDQARDIKNHVLSHLDLYLEEFERKVITSGGKVHWATTAAEARGIILDLCRSADAKMVTKGKSMISEEIALNAHLEQAGLNVVETDLGEYIIQLRHETPSHIIAPAVHLTREDVVAEFKKAHTHLPDDRPMDTPEVLVAEARGILREKFLGSDVGITGANFLIAETGTTVIVTNEGNGDLTQLLPKMHIVVASIEKIVPTLEDATAILRVLARSATGQEMSNYTTFSTGPKRADDPDGPSSFHVVLLDGGRSALIGTELQDSLRCIRCGACMNHCPVYQAIGGHAYGWVYPGPIGAVMTPTYLGVEKAGHLPNASTFCGRCEEVCPMRIPLPKMMRHFREEEFKLGKQAALPKAALSLWAWAAQRPSFYHLSARIGIPLLKLISFGSGRFKHLPFASGWTQHRDLPVPEGGTFQAQWAAGKRLTSVQPSAAAAAEPARTAA